jgi:nucleoside-diphosphate kinase
VEETLFIIKPDGVKRGLTGEIITRIERTGAKIVEMHRFVAWQDIARAIYDEHRAKPFFKDLTDTMCAGPSIWMIVQGNEVVKRMRALQGPAFDPPAGTIRGDFMYARPETVTHTSDSIEAGKREVAIMVRRVFMKLVQAAPV